ncbi:hypothetical protein BX600DRAFT_181772 [Xylariales sp. PMI_506]|nr:hypothetical protein BX600DRAFT_181772 [Xylariales sp. PMI_506]
MLGVPLSDMAHDVQNGSFERSPSEIIFVRSRMLYARAALNAHGRVQFGLRHIHILNRAPFVQQQSLEVDESARSTRKADLNTLKVMMYMFPRQFDMHNAFTSKVDYTETTQRLKDYTLREQEIVHKFGHLDGQSRLPKIPKRLRGDTKSLLQRLQILHSHCSYAGLVQYYCPVASIFFGT